MPAFLCGSGQLLLVAASVIWNQMTRHFLILDSIKAILVSAIKAQKAQYPVLDKQEESSRQCLADEKESYIRGLTLQNVVNRWYLCFCLVLSDSVLL